jgi:acyl-CoA dehydrogenase
MIPADILALPLFDDGHRAWAERVSDFARSEVPALADHRDVDAACRRLVAALGRAGLLAPCVPAEAGGMHPRLDVRTLSVARAALAYEDGLADFAFAMQGLGSGPISLAGTAEQKARWLPTVREGKAVAAFALSEPEAGSDVAATATTARRDGETYVLDGEKTWISNGGIADVYTVFARTGEAPGARGLSAFIVPADAPGLRVAERIEVIAPHPLARLAFEGCRVPADALIGKPGEGFKVAMATLDVFRTTVGAAALGFGRRALDEAVERAGARRMFGATLGDLQLTQAAIGESAAELDAAALLIARAAYAKDMGQPRVTREAAMAKLVATENAQKVIDRAVQLHGGLGVTVGSKVEALYREIRALRIYEGASEVQTIVIARAVMEAAVARGAAPLKAAE